MTGLYTKSEAQRIINEQSPYNPRLIICNRCNKYCNMVQFAVIQIQGEWLCDDHTEEETPDNQNNAVSELRMRNGVLYYHEFHSPKPPVLSNPI